MDIKEAQQTLIKLESKHRYVGPIAPPRKMKEFSKRELATYFEAQDAFTENGKKYSHLDTNQGSASHRGHRPPRMPSHAKDLSGDEFRGG